MLWTPYVSTYICGRSKMSSVRSGPGGCQGVFSSDVKFNVIIEMRARLSCRAPGAADSLWLDKPATAAAAAPLRNSRRSIRSLPHAEQQPRRHEENRSSSCLRGVIDHYRYAQQLHVQAGPCRQPRRLDPTVRDRGRSGPVKHL